MTIETKTAKIEHFCANRELSLFLPPLSPPLLPDMEQAILKTLGPDCMVRMTSEIISHLESGEDVIATERVPTSWWQHLRQAIGLKHRTREIQTVVQRYRCCPHIAIPSSDQKHIRWMFDLPEPPP